MHKTSLYSTTILLGCFNTTSIHSAAIDDTKPINCNNAQHNDIACNNIQPSNYSTNIHNGKFIKFDAAGKKLPDNATNHVCIKDVVTGLMWEVKTTDGGLRDKSWTYSWYNSTSTDGNSGIASGGTCHTSGHCDIEKFVQDVNAIGLCGFHNWRLPTTDELLTIIDNETDAPLINNKYFPNTVSQYFWSSSTDANFTSYALTVCFKSGYVFYGYRNDSYPIRLVR